MNLYNAYYNGRNMPIYAMSLHRAKLAAVLAFNPPRSKRHMVHCELEAVNVGTENERYIELSTQHM